MFEVAIVALTYVCIGFVVSVSIASNGVDEDGRVYDDSAVTWGIALGMVWPIGVFALVAEKIVIKAAGASS